MPMKYYHLHVKKIIYQLHILMLMDLMKYSLIKKVDILQQGSIILNFNLNKLFKLIKSEDNNKKKNKLNNRGI